jgi:hypothetical protein
MYVMVFHERMESRSKVMYREVCIGEEKEVVVVVKKKKKVYRASYVRMLNR